MVNATWEFSYTDDWHLWILLMSTLKECGMMCTGCECDVVAVEEWSKHKLREAYLLAWK